MNEGIVDALLAAPPRLGRTRLLAVDGPSGSGKSTRAVALVAVLRGRGVSTALVRTDDLASWDEPVAWWSRLERGVLVPAAAGRAGRFTPTVWDVPRCDVEVPVTDVLVVEGVSSARRRVAARVSLALWVELAPAAARLERAVARDGERERAHLQAWQHFEQGWFDVDDTRARADIELVERDNL